ncbi:MAG: isopentenyl-diphosphate delta-isomerase [Bacteroidota bacterium]
MQDRKKDHINLAFESLTKGIENDDRFYYEPLLSAHPTGLKPVDFLGKTLKAPIWISSMTGGTKMAGKINRNLARVASEFGLGMGLGSCRCLIENDDCFDDFNVRSFIGDKNPLYTNLGIGQIEQLLVSKKTDLVEKMIEKLDADGLIIHVNPLQEFFQPEGDRFKSAPINILEKFLTKTKIKVIIKEVGQGMGKESLRSILKLPIEAIEFGAFGGTNFSNLELMRNDDSFTKELTQFKNVGHMAAEMLEFLNELIEEHKGVKLKKIIISGGISSFLDGYYLINKSKLPAIYGQGSAFLRYAMQDYESLQKFVQSQIKGLEMAYSFLKIKH